MGERERDREREKKGGERERQVPFRRDIFAGHVDDTRRELGLYHIHHISHIQCVDQHEGVDGRV